MKCLRQLKETRAIRLLRLEMLYDASGEEIGLAAPAVVEAARRGTDDRSRLLEEARKANKEARVTERDLRKRLQAAKTAMVKSREFLADALKVDIEGVYLVEDGDGVVFWRPAPDEDATEEAEFSDHAHAMGACRKLNAGELLHETLAWHECF